MKKILFTCSILYISLLASAQLQGVKGWRIKSVKDSAAIGKVAYLDSGILKASAVNISALSVAASQWTTVTGGINYSGGNVGIGSATPGYLLDVKTSATGFTRLLNVEGSVDPGNGATRAWVGNPHTALLINAYGSGSVLADHVGVVSEKGNLLIGTVENKSLKFYTNNNFAAPQFTISNAGVAKFTSLAGTGSRVVLADASGNMSASSVTSTELGYVSGVTSSIQTQLSGKQGALTLTTTGTSGAATLTGNTLNIPQYSGGAASLTYAQNALASQYTLTAGSGVGLASVSLADGVWLVSGQATFLNNGSTDDYSYIQINNGGTTAAEAKGVTLHGNQYGSLHASTIITVSGGPKTVSLQVGATSALLVQANGATQINAVKIQ